MWLVEGERWQKVKRSWGIGYAVGHQVRGQLIHYPDIVEGRRQASSASGGITPDCRVSVESPAFSPFFFLSTWLGQEALGEIHAFGQLSDLRPQRV